MSILSRMRKTSLSYRLLAGVVLGSSAITFIITIFSIVRIYQHGLERVESELKQIETLYLPGVTQSLWDLNDEHVQLNLNGIINLGNIKYATIESASVITHSAGQPTTGDSKEIKLPIVYHQGKNFYDLGTLTAVASLEGVYDEILNQVVFDFFSSLFKTMILSAFMLLLFHQVLTRHLMSISKFLRDNSLSDYTKLPKLRLHRALGTQDELTTLTQAINEMRFEIAEQLKHRNKAEKDLRKLNASLETEVKRRIKENADQQVILQNAARLSSLGEMAGGIAHEINNPLTIISGYVGMLRKGLTPPGLPAQKLDYIGERIDTTIDRITTIIQGLLRLSRDTQKEDFRIQSLNPIVNDAIALCREKFSSKGIELKLDISEEELLCPCKPVEIGQIIINLLNNAHDAVEFDSSPWVELSLQTHDGQLALSVSDSGPGIPEHIKSKIVEPFFTTKPAGKGTGLGLSISRAIAEKHNGRLFLDESVSNTRFILELPLSKN